MQFNECEYHFALAQTVQASVAGPKKWGH